MTHGPQVYQELSCDGPPVCRGELECCWLTLTPWQLPARAVHQGGQTGGSQLHSAGEKINTGGEGRHGTRSWKEVLQRAVK